MTEPIRLKSAYEPSRPEDGSRYLVETFWPEGAETHDLVPCGWARELAPSYFIQQTALWLKWSYDRFQNAYEQELLEPERHVRFMELVKEARSGTVTLLHNSRQKAALIGPADTSAYYLKQLLEAALKTDSTARPSCAVVYPDFISGSCAEDSDRMEQWADEGGR